MSNEWDGYIKKIVATIKEYNKTNIAIVGVYGSYRKRKKRLRVYVNGGAVMELPLDSRGKFSYCESYLDKEQDGTWKYFDDKDHDKLVQIINETKGNKYYWKDSRALKEYLSIVDKATKDKFNGKKEKERCHQVELYNQNRDNNLLGMCLFDIEFQSIYEMNMTSEELKRYMKSGKDIRQIHCAKPDYLAVTPKGFALVELKTNRKALVGKAGVGAHDDDFNKLIEVNKDNQILVKELITRLKIAKAFELVDDEGVDKILKEAEKNVNGILIEKRFIFKKGQDLLEDECFDYISKMRIKKDEWIII